MFLFHRLCSAAPHATFGAILGATLLSAAPLAAENPVHYGFSVQMDVPLSNIKTDLNGKLGGGLGFQVTVDTSARSQVRGRFDIDVFRVSDYHRSNSNYEEHSTMSSIAIGAEGLFALEGSRTRGAYALVGGGILRWEQSWSASDHWHNYGNTWSDHESKRNRVSPWVSAGMGYQFNKLFSLEVRAMGSQYDGPKIGGLSNLDSEVPTETRTAVSTQLAGVFRW